MVSINNICLADRGNGTERALTVNLIVAKNAEHSQLTFIFLCLSILVKCSITQVIFFFNTVGLKKKNYIRLLYFRDFIAAELLC